MPQRSSASLSTSSSTTPPYKRRSTSRSASPSRLIDHINALPLEAFKSAYLPNPASSTLLTFTSRTPSPPASCSRFDTNTYAITLLDAHTMSSRDLDNCLQLVVLTSRDAYEGSSVGWSARRKKAEMKEVGMRFSVVRCQEPRGRGRTGGTGANDREGEVKVEVKAEPERETASRLVGKGVHLPAINGEGEEHSLKEMPCNLDNEDNSNGTAGPPLNNGNEQQDNSLAPLTDRDDTFGCRLPIQAFLSFLPTLSESGELAIYCYEIHLLPQLRACGLGRHLMHVFETIGRAIGVEKAMLTVFTSNADGLRFYERLGYNVDEESPRVKRLRGGRVRRADYLILSKPLR